MIYPFQLGQKYKNDSLVILGSEKCDKGFHFLCITVPKVLNQLYTYYTLTSVVGNNDTLKPGTPIEDGDSILKLLQEVSHSEIQ